MTISNNDSKPVQPIGKATIRFSVISLFPEMFDAIRHEGVVSRAIKSNIVSLDCINPRDFTKDKHRTVDDRPYGGGPGMLMKVEPLEKAIIAAENSSAANCLNENNDVETVSKKPKVIYLSPHGKRFDHQLAQQLTEENHLILVSGRYEGVDQRLIDQQVELEISLGDFVLSGGELAAMAVIDAVTRLLPSVLGHSGSAIEDSYVDGLLDHPHYTRPENYSGRKVPAVLLSGDHKAIANWRLKQRLGLTWLKRPDLLALKKLSDSEQTLLEEFKRAYKT